MEVVLQSHLFEALLGSLPLLMVTVGLGGAGGSPAVTGGGPLPGTRPFGLPGGPKLGSRGRGAALLLGNTGTVPFPVGQIVIRNVTDLTDTVSVTAVTLKLLLINVCLKG